MRLRFSDKEQAIAFAEKCGIEYRVQEPAEKGVTPKVMLKIFILIACPGTGRISERLTGLAKDGFVDEK